MRWLLILALLTPAAVIQQQQGQQRTKPEVVQIGADYVAAPPTLAEAWEKSDVIVRVRVRDSKQTVRGTTSPRPTIEHSVRIEEVFKDDGSLKNKPEINLSQLGGTAVVKGVQYTVDTEDAPILKVGAEYVLFLRNPRQTGRYLLSLGPASAFAVSGSTIEVPGLAQRMDVFDRKSKVPKDSLLEKLRSFKKTGGRL